MASQPMNYLASRGFNETSPEALNESLRVVLESMKPLAYGDATSGLTAEEQAVLREGGMTLEPTPGADPLAETAVKYAAIVTRSLSTEDARRRLKISASRVRQLIADHSLYSFLIDGKRYIPDFQFGPKDKLIPNIARVNKAMNPQMHPVEVYNWLHLPNVDLFLDDDMDATVSPLDWLNNGRDIDLLLQLASRL